MEYLDQLGQRAAAAKYELQDLTAEKKTAVLKAAAGRLRGS